MLVAAERLAQRRAGERTRMCRGEKALLHPAMARERVTLKVDIDEW